jgi:hypothetical protein
MVKTKLNFDRKYLIDIESVDKNKLYAVSAISINSLKDRIECLWVENHNSIKDSISSAFKGLYTDGYPFKYSDAKYIYDVEKQIRDENIIAFKHKDHLELKERSEF